MDSNSSDKRGKEREKPKIKKTGTIKNILKESTENKFTNQFNTSNQASKLNSCSGNWPNDNLKNYNNKMKALPVNIKEFVQSGWLNQKEQLQNEQNKRLVELANHARSIYNEMLLKYENEERKPNYNNIQPMSLWELKHHFKWHQYIYNTIDNSLIN